MRRERGRGRWWESGCGGRSVFEGLCGEKNVISVKQRERKGVFCKWIEGGGIDYHFLDLYDPTSKIQ